MVAEFDAADPVDEARLLREQPDSISAVPMSLEMSPDGPIAVPAQKLPPLTDEIVRATIERLRRSEPHA